MRFTITRASTIDNTEQPCKGAFIVEKEVEHGFTWVQRCVTVKRNPEFSEKKPFWWKIPQYIPVRSTRVTVVEDNVTIKWGIDIESVEELVALSNELEDDLIVSENRIMIYDDYIE